MRHLRVGTGPVVAVQFTPDGTALLCTEGNDQHSGHRAVHRIDLASWTVAHTLDLGEDAVAGAETGKAFVSPDGRWVAVQRYWGGPVFLDLRDLRTGEWYDVPLTGPNRFCDDAATFTPDCEILIYASGTNGDTESLERQEMKSGQHLPSIDFAGRDFVRQLLFSPDERRLAALGSGGVYLFDHRREPVDMAGAAELQFEDEAGPIRFRPDGLELAIAFGYEVHFWDGQSDTAEVVQPAGLNAILDLGYAPDGCSLALACDDGIVRVWDRAAGKLTREFDWQIGPTVFSVCFAPDGQTCAAGGTDGRVVLWDVID